MSNITRAAVQAMLESATTLGLSDAQFDAALRSTLAIADASAKLADAAQANALVRWRMAFQRVEAATTVLNDALGALGAAEDALDEASKDLAKRY